MGISLGRGWERGEGDSHRNHPPVEMIEDALAVALLIVILVPVDILGALGQQGIDEACQLVGCGNDGFGIVKSPRESSIISTEGTAGY